MSAHPQLYALRLSGGGGMFVRALPHDHRPENFVDGWDNAAMLTFASEELAKAAKAADPDGESLMVERVDEFFHD